jgi:hypothetical protein
MLTLFTAPKPFDGHVGVIQTNALRSWKELGRGIEILLVGVELGLEQAASALGIRVLANVRKSPSGAPSLQSALAEVRRVARHATLAYVNADILLLDDFLPAVERVTQRLGSYLIVGQRWDLDVRAPMAFGDRWEAKLRDTVHISGSLHRPVGSDYFVFPARQYADLPDFTLGRSGWDNWMIYDSRRRRIPVVDASRAITAVHQNHDYSHLPGGRPHYRHPESLRNVDLGGGRVTNFRLEDADWVLRPEGPSPKRLLEWRYPRRWEAGLIARWGSGRRATLARMVFRPREAFRYISDLARGRRAGAGSPSAAGGHDARAGIEE